MSPKQASAKKASAKKASAKAPAKTSRKGKAPAQKMEVSSKNLGKVIPIGTPIMIAKAVELGWSKTMYKGKSIGSKRFVVHKITDSMVIPAIPNDQIPSNLVTKRMKKTPDLDANVRLYKDFVPHKLAKSIVKSFAPEEMWHAPVYNIHGKDVIAPRKCSGMIDSDRLKQFQEYISTAVEWTPEMIKLRDLVTELTGDTYDRCQIIEYPDKDSYLGLHRDDENPEGVIACVSLGATRDMTFEVRPQLRPKAFLDNEYEHDSDSQIYFYSPPAPKRWVLEVPGNSLYTMDNAACGARSQLKHGCKKSLIECGTRWSITFRQS